MKLLQLEECITGLFGQEQLRKPGDEWGFTNKGADEVAAIGYATNLTPETVREAIDCRVNAIVTHHDAWDFIYGMKERCLAALQEHGISHCFFHLPLDGADFGTSVTLAQRLGLKIVEKCHLVEDCWYCGRIGELDDPMEFGQLKDRLCHILEEPVRGWQNNSRPVNRVCVATGAALMTTDVKEAVDMHCDAYVTGEKSLYTVEYAQFAGINLLIGSHTFTELPGVESLAQIVGKRFPDVQITRLREDHIE